MAERTPAEKEAIEKEYQAKVDSMNASRSGVGTRAAYGFTRGKSSMPFIYERFDTAHPDTLPKGLEAFCKATGIDSDEVIGNLLIDGYNEKLYTEASDPIAEYVDETWTSEVATKFRLLVRNYASGAEVSLEDAVAVIKPGFVKAQAKQVAAAQ